MKRRLGGGLLALTLGCAGSPAKVPPSAATPADASTGSQRAIPADLTEAIERSFLIGRELYMLDGVAALATDVLFEKISDAHYQALGGYLPLRESVEHGRAQDSFLVTFFTREHPPRVAYEVRVVPDELPAFVALSPPKPVSETMAELIRARQTAIDAMPPTRQPINPILLPAEFDGEEGSLVYLLAGTTTPHLAVFGQHFRALVPAGGSKPKYLLPLSSSALEVPTRGPKGEWVDALTVTHLVTDYPLETHVLTGLQFGMPVYVTTSRGSWRVSGGGRIAFLGAGESAE
jgi:hypothetical protein